MSDMLGTLWLRPSAIRRQLLCGLPECVGGTSPILWNPTGDQNAVWMQLWRHSGTTHIALLCCVAPRLDSSLYWNLLCCLYGLLRSTGCLLATCIPLQTRLHGSLMLLFLFSIGTKSAVRYRWGHAENKRQENESLEYQYSSAVSCSLR